MKAPTKPGGSAQELKRQGNERLYPKLTNPNYLILRKRRELFETWLAGVPGGKLNVLDVGGHLQPYRGLVEGRISSYVAVDARRGPLVDITGRAEQLPLESGVFDLVFCTQVLEYVPDPGLAVAEIYRVLKPGGVLLLSAPSIFPRDSDEDYWRFEPAALRLLLSNFSKVEVQPEGGSIIGFFRTVNVFLICCSKIKLLTTALSYLVVLPLNVLGYWFESAALTRNTQFAANYSAMAQK